MKTNIIIAGIGGVGGYFGGVLARHYAQNEAVAVNFLARGAHLAAIRETGLRVIHTGGEFLARPAQASDDPAAFGIADFIVVAAKSYDLEAIIRQLQPAIARNTVIIPLLNGVDSRKRIEAMLPDNLVADGCVYIVARLQQAGVVENKGAVQAMYFGIDGEDNARLHALAAILQEAGIEATVPQNISTVVWEKFIFISPTATATSFFDESIGAVVANEEHLARTADLIAEVIALAHAKGIPVAEDIAARTIHRLRSLPYDATSSMHADFQSGKPVTELETLTGYVVREAKELGLDMPAYEEMLAALLARRP